MFKALTVAGVLTLVAGSFAAAGPYPPAAGQPGSTAIHMDQAALLGWATGWQNYRVGSDCDLTWQTPEKALGKAAGTATEIVSLGRGGEITLTFVPPITNGPDWDFAVFENGISDTYLELGYVEVSSNGLDFFRLSNRSLTASPVGGFGAVDPTDIDSLAGKYRQGYGTPFDLGQLEGVDPLLDVDNVGYVKIVDIIGDGTYRDTSGEVIYDPYPTTGSAGFDLDAIGVIHQVPEPGSLLLLATAGLGFAWSVARRRGRSTGGPQNRFGCHLTTWGRMSILTALRSCVGGRPLLLECRRTGNSGAIPGRPRRCNRA